MADKAVVTQTTLDAIAQEIIDLGGAKAKLTPGQMATALAALDRWPVPLKNDGKTHVWYFFGPSSRPFAHFSARYVSDGHTFDVDWGDGSVETIAASATMTSRALSHEYADNVRGPVEVVISGYDAIGIRNANPFGEYSTDSSSSIAAVRQLEVGGTVDATYAASYPGGAVAYVSLPPGTTAINGAAFTGGTNLVRIDGLLGVASVGSSAFKQCVSLVSADVSSATSIESAAFSFCPSLVSVGSLSRVATIGSSAFYGCSSLNSVTDLPSVTSIAGSAFYGCSSLVRIGDMPNLTSMGTNAFYGCSSLVSVGDMPLLAPSLYDYCFQNCSSLVSVGDMPNVATIGSYAFYKCTSLVSVGDLSGVTKVNSNAFGGGASPKSLSFATKTHEGVQEITGIANLPNGPTCVYHCADGDYYRDGSVLKPVN